MEGFFNGMPLGAGPVFLVLPGLLMHLFVHHKAGCHKRTRGWQRLGRVPGMVTLTVTATADDEYEFGHDSSLSRSKRGGITAHPAKKNPGLFTRGCRFSSLWPSSRSAKSKTRICCVGRSSGFRFVLLAALPVDIDSGLAAFVPGHSGGSATELHRFPLNLLRRAHHFSQRWRFQEHRSF
jgi:hypothetical protein